jgi:hypothetical protein
VGYGSQKRSDVTGSISSASENFNKGVVSMVSLYKSRRGYRVLNSQQSQDLAEYYYLWRGLRSGTTPLYAVGWFAL